MNYPACATLLAVITTSLPLARAAAQCADGSPPPCRAQTGAVATARRVNPALDDRTWIVVPFDNLAKNQEIDWLRGASVNLLYLDMSRWKDIRVIDDERVADLVREVPEAANAPTLSLNAGLAVAKRAGARNLVMGDVLKLGNRTNVTAKIFDVKTGQRIRSVREEAAVQDSVLPLFGKLARKILNVAPPAGANVGTVGTSSVAAYQEYLQGIQALNRFDLAGARRSLREALRLDSTFALAHHKMSVVIGWDDPNDPAIRTHAEASARLATALPPRERGLINANVLQARRDWGGACDAYSALLRADSSDVDAWYGFGDCRFHDFAVEPVQGDTTRMRFRGDLNESIHAFRRVLELDPSYHLAYQHIVDGYLSELRGGRHCVETRCTSYSAVPIRRGDSLAYTLVSLPRDSAKILEQRAEYLRTESRRRNVASATAIAEQWVATSPDEERARAAFATALLASGRVAEAQQQLERVRLEGQSLSAFNILHLRIEAAVKLWRPQAVRLYDSVRTSKVFIRAGPSQATISAGAAAALYGPLFGRLAEYDSLGRLQTARASPLQQRASPVFQRVMMGLPHDSAVALERAVFTEAVAGGSRSQATFAVAPTLVFGLRMARTEWPALDTTMTTALLGPSIALARADTTRLRAAARKLDSLSAAYAGALVPDTGMTLMAAEAYLALRDSAPALRMTRRMLDSALAHTALSPRIGGFPYMLLLPRAILLRADLAAALGHRDEAREWYARFIDLWGTAVPELQPIVERARKSRAALSP